MTSDPSTLPAPDPTCDCCHGEGFVDHGPSVSVCRCVDVEELRAAGEGLATVVRTCKADGDLGPVGLAYLEAWERAT